MHQIPASVPGHAVGIPWLQWMYGRRSSVKSGPAIKLTYDDFVQFRDDAKRHELIDGCHS